MNDLNDIIYHFQLLPLHADWSHDLWESTS